MARKKLARRFEPRGGVSQPMLEAECRFISRELEDYLLLSITDLRQKLNERPKRIAELEPHLQRLLSALADRERLALRCIIARDVFHIISLFLTFVQSPDAPQTTGVVERNIGKNVRLPVVLDGMDH